MTNQHTKVQLLSTPFHISVKVGILVHPVDVSKNAEF
jgi:hypothetical protein